MHGWSDVGVDHAGDVGAAVVEAFADDFDVDAFLQLANHSVPAQRVLQRRVQDVVGRSARCGG